ncbi:unnamed protein product [Pocillopora meandrina]|uniref:Uncharacterized protein n=1 Tax=Pocillopora meandrina TaxID=46732 RepID=A0AAU9VT44_9CNID|nr:unnamed protein product [Pocillopora meandrina]
MKTTALCVFALFLSSMLVEGSILNNLCIAPGDCDGKKDKPKKSSTENVGDNGEAGNLEMMKMNIRRRLEEVSTGF